MLPHFIGFVHEFGTMTLKLNLIKFEGDSAPEWSNLWKPTAARRLGPTAETAGFRQRTSVLTGGLSLWAEDVDVHG